MLRVEEALAAVAAECRPLAPVETSLAESLGLVLFEAVASDIDSPPYDKSVVDGYAMRSRDTLVPDAMLEVIERVMAGGLPTKPVGAGQTTQIMTGAPLPEGADCVVMIERTLPFKPTGGRERIQLRDVETPAGHNIMRQGVSFTRGEVLLEAGHKIRAIEIGVLAEVGRASVKVVPRPRVAVVSTGDELVDHRQVPQPGQIRNSNGPLLEALVVQAGGVVASAQAVGDKAELLEAAIRAALAAADVVVLSGGVSAGVLDLVPSVLETIGVERVFHKIRLKPGKPLWFGRYRHEDQRPTLVFGLPGNPVSSLIGFELFVRPALSLLAGNEPSGNGLAGALKRESAVLTTEFEQRGERATYYPARLIRQADGSPSRVELLKSKGSGDLRTLASALCWVHFPPGEEKYQPGAIVEVVLL